VAKPYGTRVIDCPTCSKPIGDQHPYQWCCECGNPLSVELQMQIPSMAKRITARNAALAAKAAPTP